MSLFWNPAGRLACAATLLLPSAGVFGLYYVFRNSLDSMVEVTRPQRTALTLHALYFAACVLEFEVLIDQFPMTTTGSPPEKPDNLFWQMSCLSGEVFFVAATALGFMATQSSVPRWSLLVPFAQVFYNLRNSLIWCVLHQRFSPVGEPIKLMYLDGVFILGVTAVYLHHYFTAPTIESPKDKSS
jgi:hypothetical protein